MKETIIHALLSSAVYPLVVGVILAFVLAKLFPYKQAGRDWREALTLLAAFLACFYTTVALSGFPPVKVFDWIPYVTLLALITMAFPAMASLKWRVLAQVVTTVIATYLYLRPVGRSWSTAHFIGILALCLICWILFWCSHEKRTEDKDTNTRLLLMVFAATGASLVSVLSHSAKLAQVSGGLAAACGSLFLARLAIPSIRLGTMTTATFMAALGCVILNAGFYVEVPLYALCLVGLSALGHLLLKLPAFAHLSGLKRGTLVVVLSLLPMIGAITGLALTPEDDYYDY